MTGEAEPFTARGSKSEIEQGASFAPLFDADGLIPAIVVDQSGGDVVMFAWMDREAVSLSLASGYAHFWSRSRKRIWQKGEESGNRLRIVELRTDCDQDVLLLHVIIEGNGVACHTGTHSCFYRKLLAPHDRDEPARLERRG